MGIGKLFRNQINVLGKYFRAESLSEFILTLVLIILGFLTFIVATLDSVLGFINLGSDTPLAIKATLMMLGLISTAIGGERVLRFPRIHDKLNTILQIVLRNDRIFLYLDSERELIDAVIPMLENTPKGQLRAFVYADTQSPKEWAEVIAKRYKHLHEERRGNPRLRAVMAVNYQDVPRDFAAEINSRYEIYKSEGVDELVDVSLINVAIPLGVDIFIADDSVILGIPSTSERGKLRGGVMIMNDPDVAKSLMEWFDQELIPNAEGYAKAIGRDDFILRKQP